MSGSTNKLLESLFKKLSDDEQKEEIRNLSTLLRAVFIDKLEGESSQDYRLRSFSLLLNHLPRDSSCREDFFNKYISDELKREFIVAPNMLGHYDAKYLTYPPYSICNACLQNYTCYEPPSSDDLEHYNRGNGSIQNYPYSIHDANFLNNCSGWTSTRTFDLKDYNRVNGRSLMAKRSRCSIL